MKILKRIFFGAPPPPLKYILEATREKTERDLFNAELELELAKATRDMYAERLERLAHDVC